MQQAKLHTRSGQSLIEAMIAISILVIGFLGTMTLINRSVGLTRTVADSYVGSYLAGEGVEVIKNLIDANYIAQRPFFKGFEGCTEKCVWEFESDATWERGRPAEYRGQTFIYDPIQRIYTYSGIGVPTSFKREVMVKLLGSPSNEIEVSSRVEWIARGGGTSAVTVEDHFFNWFASGSATSTVTATSAPSTKP